MTPTPLPLDTVAAWAVDLMETLGAPGAGIAIALENLFPPLPSEIILPLAGFTASRGGFSLLEALVWTTVGSVLGALALYGLGVWFGAERLKRIADRLPLVRVSDVERAEAWFARHGGKAVLLGRMVPLFRSLISVPAGVQRMSLMRFTVLTTIGSGIWNTVFVLAGYGLGENWHLVEQYADILQKLVILVCTTALAGFLAIRIRQGLRARAAR
ncbi:DedA family protein [Brachybacterium hainanense]|uniref:DedA family protein n=1 Tax=Brachybacterium hainanense TaxID=1541174 RepID=A0ABV6R8Z3_9MICO